MQCGRDFSIGIDDKTKQILVWGNYRYLCNPAVRENIPKPTHLKYDSLFSDVFCQYHYVVAVTEKTELVSWGEFCCDFNASKSSA